MLDLNDFFHLPELDTFIQEMTDEGPGLIILAGLDPVTASAEPDSFLPSGRAAIFRILARHMLAHHPQARALLITEQRNFMRVSRSSRSQIEVLHVEPPHTYASRITYATFRVPQLLIIDRLDAETAPLALRAAQHLKVLAQMDSVFSGTGVTRQLMDWGIPSESLEALRWIVTVQRISALCPRCKQAFRLSPERLDELNSRYPGLSSDGTFYQASGCPECGHTGRQGTVAAFDVFHARRDLALTLQTSRLPLQEYVLRLAAQGRVSLDDATDLESDQLRRTYNLLAQSERALSEVNAALQRKLAQLEAANKVLEQRTEALISLQDISHTLITSAGLDELAARVCRHTQSLCGANRAILYFFQPDSMAQVLAINGWEAALVHSQIEATRVLGAGGTDSAEPKPFAGYPPGIDPAAHKQDPPLKAGLRVPLIAQQEIVGLMIVHSTDKPDFAPGQIALLRAFADQAAVAIQRAGLIDSLQDKIAQLETAQAELVQKERLDRELELARQVQQRLLPRTFPMIPGFSFAARCEPARRVGGDFYDVILLDGDCFGAVIADVSDKGMPAALFMALTRSLLLSEARRERSPRAVLTNVHRLLVELGQPEMFVTMFYGIVDVPRRRMTFTRAGHDRPLLLRNGAAEPLAGQGAFLGYLEAAQLGLSEEQIDLHPGDKLVLYTDGLVDAVDGRQQLFGLSRLAPLLQSLAQLPAPDLCAATFDQLAAYQGQAEQFDDMTMLVIQVNEHTKSLAQ